MKGNEANELVGELYVKLRLAEIALCNSVPVTPYQNEGPLPTIRETLKKVEEMTRFDPRSSEAEKEWRRINRCGRPTSPTPETIPAPKKG